MQVEIEWQDAVRFSAIADSQHAVSIDGPADLGGVNAGTRPMELMLMGIGGCAATDVVHILRKGRVTIDSCRVTVDAERAEQEPKVFTDIHLRFQVAGKSLTEKKLARAVSLSAEKYCSASILMNRAGVNVTHSYELLSD